MRPTSTATEGAMAGGTPAVCSSSSTRLASAKSRTSMAARKPARSAMRCSSIGSAPSASLSIFLKRLCASSHCPWRA